LSGGKNSKNAWLLDLERARERINPPRRTAVGDAKFRVETQKHGREHVVKRKRKRYRLRGAG